MHLSKYFAVFAFVLCLFLAAPANAQCPMCKANVESTMKGGGKKTGMGLNDGIMVLFAMPYMAVGIVGFLWYRNSKLRKKTQTPFTHK
ncbi:MAG: hypothetical protein ACXWEY_01100 [Bacteroidia bacterium]